MNVLRLGSVLLLYEQNTAGIIKTNTIYVGTLYRTFEIKSIGEKRCVDRLSVDLARGMP